MAQLPGDASNPIVIPQADRPTVSYTGGQAQAAAITAGQATAGLGDEMVKVGGQIQDTQNKLARASAEQAFISKKLDLDQQFATDTDYATAPQRYRDALQGIVAQTGQGIMGASQRADFSNNMAKWVEYGTNTMRATSAKKAVDAGRGDTIDSLNQAVSDALRAPDEPTRAAIFSTVHDRIDAAQDAGWFTATEAAKYRKSVPQSYAGGRAQMLVDTDPAAAVTALAPSSKDADGTPIFDKTNDWRDYLEPPQRAKMYREAQAHVTEGSTVFRGSVEDRFKNNTASLLNTGEMAQPLTGDEIRTAYPVEKYGDKADHMIRQLQGAGQVGNATKDMALTSPQEDEAKVGQFTPKLGTPDYGDQIDRQNALVTAYNQKYQAINKDPAAYVLGASPQIAGLNDKAMKDPTQMGAYVSALNAAYDKLGVPQNQRAIMPSGQAQQLAQTITADPENAPAKLKQMQQQTGPAWDDVWHTLTTAGKLPAAYQAVGTLDNERDAALLAKAIAEQGKTGKAWGDIIGSKAESDIKTTIRGDDSVKALLSSLSRSGAPATQVDSILGSIDTLAYAKTFYDRDPKAAQSAIDSFTTKYEFMPNGGARVPSNLMPQVQANARATLDTLDPSKVAVPPIYDKPGMPKADEYTDLIKASPTWITSPRADALWLMDNGGRLVRDKKGNPIAVPFATPMPVTAPVGLSPNFSPISSTSKGYDFEKSRTLNDEEEGTDDYMRQHFDAYGDRAGETKGFQILGNDRLRDFGVGGNSDVEMEIQPKGGTKHGPKDRGSA